MTSPGGSFLTTYWAIAPSERALSIASIFWEVTEFTFSDWLLIRSLPYEYLSIIIRMIISGSLLHDDTELLSIVRPALARSGFIFMEPAFLIAALTLESISSEESSGIKVAGRPSGAEGIIDIVM